MKKIIIGFAISFTTFSFAQQYPNNGWDYGYYHNDNGYYTDQDDQNYFPDDYYYNYPQDYYPQDYYQSNYNDYRNSVINVNWNVFFTQNRLSPWQISQIQRLNNLYVSFSSWNNFYRYNPDRWYYDRFYALERIMGPRVFVVFRNNYYRGYSSPVVYFQNYRRVHYAPIYRPMPRYRNVNINMYRVDRARFQRMSNPTFNIVRSSRQNNGLRGSVINGNSGGFRTQADNRNNGSGFRNDNNGVRNNSTFRTERSENRSGFRGNTQGFRSGSAGVRRGEVKRSEGNSFQRSSNDSGFGQRNESAVPRGNSNRNSSGSGFRS